jgi:ankyrin repeat protein
MSATLGNYLLVSLLSLSLSLCLHLSEIVNAQAGNKIVFDLGPTTAPLTSHFLLPFHSPAKRGDVKAIKPIVESAFTVVALNETDSVSLPLVYSYPHCHQQRGRTPLMLACIYGKFNVMEELLTSGADVAARDDVRPSLTSIACTDILSRLEKLCSSMQWPMAILSRSEGYSLLDAVSQRLTR